VNALLRLYESVTPGVFIASVRATFWCRPRGASTGPYHGGHGGTGHPPSAGAIAKFNFYLKRPNWAFCTGSNFSVNLVFNE